jgi:hypothetical protein
MKHTKGFTLIETLMYLALFTLIIGGGMLATYQIIESTTASYGHILLQEEGNFILRKIAWGFYQPNTNIADLVALHSGNVTVSNLVILGNTVSFTLSTLENGRTISRHFSITNYQQP